MLCYKYEHSFKMRDGSTPETRVQIQVLSCQVHGSIAYISATLQLWNVMVDPSSGVSLESLNFQITIPLLNSYTIWSKLANLSQPEVLICRAEIIKTCKNVLWGLMSLYMWKNICCEDCKDLIKIWKYDHALLLLL